MRAFVGLAVLLLLAGCLASSSDKYFPPAADLPDGLTPITADSIEWKAAAPYLGMETNPGRVGVLDHLPHQDLGHVASVEAYLLQGNGTGAGQDYGILVLRFNGTADVGAYLAKAEASACDGKDMAHILRDGAVYVLVGGDGSTEHGKQVLGDLARVVQARSGAALVC